MSRSRAPDVDPNWSEFENLLRCAVDVSGARTEIEQGELGTKNSKGQSQNEQSLEGPEAKTRLHLDRAMSNTSSRADESPSSSDRRHYARQRIKSLSYLDLGRDNGGIVLNISEGGLAVHAVGIFVDNPTLPLRLRLPGSNEQLEATGQVAWTSESKREAGIHFVDLSEQTRTQIKEWVSKQDLSAERETDGGSQREKRKQVLEIPPRRESKTSVTEPAVISGMTNEEFNTMFPSEKSPVPWHKSESPATDSTLSVAPSAIPYVSASPSGSAAPDRLGAIPRTRDLVSFFEGEANAPADENPELLSSPKSSTPVSPSTSQAHVISNEKLLPQVSSEEAIPALPPSSTQVPSSGPVTRVSATPKVLSPVSRNDDVTPSSAPAATYKESQPEIPPLDDDIAFSPAPESGAREAAEVETSAERLSSALPIPVKPDTPPLGDEDATPTRFEKASPINVPSPSGDVETRSSAAMVRDLRAILNRGGAIRKSAQRHTVTKQESPTSSPSDGATAVSPVAELPVATASPVASTSTSNLPLSPPEEPPAAQPRIESPMTGILPGAPVSPESNKQSSQFSKGNWDSMKSFRPLAGVQWQPTAVLILVFVAILAIGIAVDRGTFGGLRGGAGSSANRPLVQAALPAPDNAGTELQSKPVNREVHRQHRHEFASIGSATTASVESQHRQGLGGPAAVPRQSATFAPILSSPIVANRAVQAGTSEQESPPAIPVQLGKAGDDSPGAAAADSWNSAAKLAPPQPMPQIAAQGDRVVAGSLLYRVEALYPPEAAQKHIEGTVKLRAVIGRDGRVMGLGVVSGPPSLVSAAITAAREWRYIPALLNGQPVESETDIDIEFRLSQEANR